MVPRFLCTRKVYRLHPCSTSESIISISTGSIHVSGRSLSVKAAMAEVADGDATVAANRLVALARRSAKDAVVDIDLESRFKQVVQGGHLQSELSKAFEFTQKQLDGIFALIFLCCVCVWKFFLMAH